MVEVVLSKEVVKEVEVPVNHYITEKDVVEKIVEKVVPVEKVITNVEVV